MLAYVRLVSLHLNTSFILASCLKVFLLTLGVKNVCFVRLVFDAPAERKSFLLLSNKHVSFTLIRITHGKRHCRSEMNIAMLC